MMFSEDCGFLPVLEDTFTSDELHELLSVIQSEFPTHSPSGSETSQNGFLSHSHSHSHSHSASGSETTRSVYSVEERKRRRMISNRESAQRSRWRKKQQLEDFTNEMNRLKLENRELKNQLCLVRHQYQAVQRDSIRLTAESIDLQQNLSALRQFLVNMQLQ